MADDIDELLDEVESKFIGAENRLREQPAELSGNEKSGNNGRNDGGEELDAAISSICGIPEPIGVSSISPAAVQQIAKAGKRRCTVVYVGGPQAPSTSPSSNASHRRNIAKRPKPGAKISTKRYFAKPVFELSVKDLEAESTRRKQKELVETLFEKKLAVVTDKMILDVRKFKRIKSDVWSNFGDVRLLISESDAKSYNIDHHIIHIGEEEMLLCKSFVACVKCCAVFSYEGHRYGTSTLRAHLKSCGKPRYNMREKKYQMLRLKRSLADVAPVNNSNSFTESFEPYQDVKPVFQEQMIKFRDHASKLQDQMLLFFVSKLKPLSTVENKEFKNLLQTFVQIGANAGDVDLKRFLPDPTELSDVLLQQAYVTSECAFREEIRNVYGLSFSAEIWMNNIEKMSYISLFCHYANNNGTLTSVILFTSEFAYGQKAPEDVTDIYRKTLQLMGLESFKKIVVVDYSYNMVTAIENDYPFIQCISYAVSRAVQAVLNQLSLIDPESDPFVVPCSPNSDQENDPFALPGFATLIGQCRTLVNHFKENKLQSNLPKHLVMCSSTCWKSTLDMLQSISNQWDHIMDILQERDEFQLFNFDQELLSLVVDFLELYRDGCDELSSISSPTLNIVIPWLTKWKNHCLQNDDESPFLQALKSHMSSAIDQEVVTRITIFHKLATMLDPRFKELQFLTVDDKLEAREQAIALANECQIIMAENRLTENSILPSDSKDHFADLYVSMDAENSSELTPEEEVENYLDENFVMGQQDLDTENKFNPLKYWSRNRDRYSHLSRVALWLLSCPASAVRSSDSILVDNWTVVYRESDIPAKDMHSCKFVKSFRNF